MYKIGVIGDRESILGFKAVGFEVFQCAGGDEGKKILKKMAKEDFAIIYVTEKLYVEMKKEIDEYTDLRVPAIIPVPNREGTLGVGLSNVKQAVERAVGADILFGGDR